MILFLFQLAHAEPNRVTASLSAGLDGTAPAFHGAADYGVVRHLGVAGEIGADLDGRASAAAGLLLLPVDSRWVRLGVALMPEVHDAFGDPRLAARAGVRAGWLMFWGLGLQARVDGVVPWGEAPELQVGLGLSVRM